MLKRLLAWLLDDAALVAPFQSGAPVWDGGAGAAVAQLDAKGRILAVSDGAPALLGRSRREAAGAIFLDLFADDDHQRLARGLSLGSAAGRISGRLAGGGEGAGLDLRFARRADGRIAVLMIEAASADAAPSRSQNPAGAELLADLSHEMRTPLNAVIGFAEAMTNETYGPLGHGKYEEYAGIIRASGRHLLDLVSSILDLAKIEAGRYALKRETADIGALARESAAMVRHDAEKAGLKFRLAVAGDLPDTVLDPRAIRQVLINLLSNAVKFTSDGEVALDVRRDGGDIVLSVTDTGVGMSAAELARLGARFAAHGGDGVRGAKGAGLGLSLAKALVELHGGLLDVESAPGEGVKATARLPIVAPVRPERSLERRLQRRLRAVETSAVPEDAVIAPPAILTELERIEAFRRERSLNAA